MDSEKMNQLSEAIEAKLSGILPEIGQILQEYCISELKIVFTTDSKPPAPTGLCRWDQQQGGMVCIGLIEG
jgi:hypothetical protein